MRWKTLLKVASIAIAAVFLAMQFKNGKTEYALYISLVTSIIIFIIGVEKIRPIIETLQKLQDYIHIQSSYISLLIKIIGITYIAEFTSELCKDSGHSAIAGQVEFVAKLFILGISLPIVVSLLDTVWGFM